MHTPYSFIDIYKRLFELMRDFYRREVYETPVELDHTQDFEGKMLTIYDHVLSEEECMSDDFIDYSVVEAEKFLAFYALLFDQYKVYKSKYVKIPWWKNIKKVHFVRERQKDVFLHKRKTALLDVDGNSQVVSFVPELEMAVFDNWDMCPVFWWGRASGKRPANIEAINKIARQCDLYLL